VLEQTDGTEQQVVEINAMACAGCTRLFRTPPQEGRLRSVELVEIAGFSFRLFAWLIFESAARYAGLVETQAAVYSLDRDNCPSSA
jgi:hypothetical protein